jgi:hypothetical protein
MAKQSASAGACCWCCNPGPGRSAGTASECPRHMNRNRPPVGGWLDRPKERRWDRSKRSLVEDYSTIGEGTEEAAQGLDLKSHWSAWEKKNHHQPSIWSHPAGCHDAHEGQATLGKVQHSSSCCCPGCFPDTVQSVTGKQNPTEDLDVSRRAVHTVLRIRPENGR